MDARSLGVAENFASDEFDLSVRRDNPAAVVEFLKAVPWCRNPRAERRSLTAAVFHIPQEEHRSLPEVVRRNSQPVQVHSG